MNQIVRNAVVRDPFLSFFDDVVNDLFTPRAVAARAAAAQEPIVTKARVDVIDRGRAYEVVADLPGVAKEDIRIKVEGKRLSIEATTRAEREVKEGEQVLHTERFATQYARSFALPSELDDAKAEARFENGVLTLVLPKRDVIEPRLITVQ
ncbi:Hsp20/alpha crystallin family protein [Derxia gummosa]|uniref:Hsp20/alpha crystallin family protein n=1 Tax=Derxia gummosa DSM 723 TaxID=1121388 RepID=A0A8B6X7D3_9BURK|nr:Hsp20/alpha crystallin family protein [Derxia gummosa]